jgi:hypothetical protein
MLQSVNLTCGFSIRAIDGAVGAVDEFLFDDRLWTTRYIVGSIGGWISGQLVLIPGGTLLALDRKARALEVALTQQQIVNSPDITTDQPVSRQMAGDRLQVDGVPTYWGTWGWWGFGVCPADPGTMTRMLESAAHQERRTAQEAGRRRGDPHLRSTRVVRGYGVQACDGAIGHIADFIIDDTVWAIQYIAITTHVWWPGKKVLVPARWIDAIDWSQLLVTVNAPREVVYGGPAFDPSALADPAYETWLRRAYARLQYESEASADGAT